MIFNVVNFCCTISKVIQVYTHMNTNIYMYTHTHTHRDIHSLFLHSFHSRCTIGYWIWFSVLHSRTLLCIHSIYSSLHLLTPTSYFIPASTPFPLYVPTSRFSMSIESVSVLHIGSFLSYFRYFRFHTYVVSYGICLFLT